MARKRDDQVVVLLEKYEVEGRIGSGAFGSVYRIRRKADGAKFACKSVIYAGMTQSHKEQLVAEVNIMRELKHPHIVRYVDRSIDRITGTLHIIMELCEGGDLAALLMQRRRARRHLDEEQLWRVASEVASALRDCHEGKLAANGSAVILHRDLKPANILFDANGSVKLGDFGLAKELQHECLAKTKLGTPLYMAPELVRRKPYGPPADMWSLGCILYEAATFEPPFDAKCADDLHSAILAGHRKPIPNTYSIAFRDLVASLLCYRPRERLTASALLQRHAALHRYDTPGHAHAPIMPAVLPPPLPPPPPEHHVLSCHHDRRVRQLDEREKALDDRARLLDDRTRLLDERECDLDRREHALRTRLAAHNQQPAGRRKRHSDEPFKDRNWADAATKKVKHREPLV